MTIDRLVLAFLLALSTLFVGPRDVTATPTADGDGDQSLVLSRLHALGLVPADSSAKTWHVTSDVEVTLTYRGNWLAVASGRARPSTRTTLPGSDASPLYVISASDFERVLGLLDHVKPLGQQVPSSEIYMMVGNGLTFGIGREYAQAHLSRTVRGARSSLPGDDGIETFEVKYWVPDSGIVSRKQFREDTDEDRRGITQSRFHSVVIDSFQYSVSESDFERARIGARVTFEVLAQTSRCRSIVVISPAPN